MWHFSQFYVNAIISWSSDGMKILKIIMGITKYFILRYLFYSNYSFPHLKNSAYQYQMHCLKIETYFTGDNTFVCYLNEDLMSLQVLSGYTKSLCRF